MDGVIKLFDTVLIGLNLSQHRLHVRNITDNCSAIKRFGTLLELCLV